MRVTFDTNAFDKAVRPAIYSMDPNFQEMTIVNQALKDARIQGYISETTITLEGIGRDDRAVVLGGTHARSSFAQTAEDIFTMTSTTEQPDRRPVHPKQAERLIEAFQLGIRLLGALQRPWFTALGAAKGIHERREVARAVAEWADADSIAAHYGYGNDVFCTLDFAKAETKRGEPAVFDPDNRAWLAENFGIQFVTLARLADRVRKCRAANGRN
jgi:hypothetical protein